VLFDLSGKRRNVIRVVYALLAVLFGGGFLFFGVGSDVQGGLGDLLGFGSNNPQSDPQFEEDIEEAEKAIESDPKDEEALATLISARVLAGNDVLDQSTDEETLEVSPTPEAEEHYQAAVEAWEQYAKVAKKPEPEPAGSAAQAYGAIFNFFPPELPAIQSTAADAVVAQELVADETPGEGTYFTLAQYAYLAGDTALGDEAAKQAVAEADESRRKQLEKDLETLSKLPAQIQKELEKQEKAEGKGEDEAFQNPLEESGFGGGGFGAGAAPGAPAAPVPGG